jgi:hypothetical protein
MFKRESIRLAADWLAILTGVSFILSALIQEAVFATWGLDFSAVASIEDVVMGGIRFLAILLLAFGFLGVQLVTGSLVTTTPTPRPGSVAARLYYLLIYGITSSFLFFMVYVVGITPRLSRISFYGFSILAMIFTNFSILAASSLTSSAPFLTGLKSVRIASSRLFQLLLITIGGALLITLESYRSPYNFSIYNSSRQPITCEPRHTRALIQWVGSRAMIARCPKGFVIVFLQEERFTLTAAN